MSGELCGGEVSPVVGGLVRLMSKKVGVGQKEDETRRETE